MQAITIEPRVTTRAMLDPTRKCHLRCGFCYYLHGDLESEKPWEAQKQEVLTAVANGCDSADLTGGDPLSGTHVVELVKLCVENNIWLRIITSLICPEKVLDAVLDLGATFLVSMHGAKPETHDAIVKVPNARSKQLRRLAKIAARTEYSVNYVMVGHNESEILDFAKLLLSLDHEKPRAVNWINFNPHYEWVNFREESMGNIVDYRIAGPLLDEAIDLLEKNGIAVNIRYAPMCAVAERHRKNICSDLHVAYDPFEWANGFYGIKDVAAVLHEYAIPLSRRNEEKGAPCNRCDLQWCCGGANRIWHQLAKERFGQSPLVPITLPEGRVDFWHYRGQNVLGLDPRR